MYLCTIIFMNMKKIAIFAVTTSFFLACGPSKEEIEAREKARQDSIAQAEKAMQDSIAAAQAEAERQRAEAEAKRKADSARVADSLAALEKKGGKKK
jgi:F0F1-type ATP synthase membrane subunit b/b'